MRVLITGAAGFVGSHLARRMLEDGHAAVLVDALIGNYDPRIKRRRIESLLSIHPAAQFVEADLLRLDPERLLEGVEVVLHLAGLPGVRTSWGKGFGDYVSNNVLATQRLLEAARRSGLLRFVYASSSSVYGEAERYPTPEDTLPRPVSPYGVTKLAAERLADAYRTTFGVPTISLRYFSVYGPDQRPDMAFHRFMRAILEERPIPVFGDGRQSRDFTYVSDVIEATVAAATLGGDVEDPINVGGGSVATINECIETLGRIVGRSVDVEHLDRQAGDARHTCADLTRARSALGYHPKVSLEEGLRAQWEWLSGLW